MRAVIFDPPGAPVFTIPPWTFFLEGLRSAGVEPFVFRNSEDLEFEAVVSLNYQGRALSAMRRRRIPPERSALIVLEPKVTSPMSYLPKRITRFSHRFAASPIWASMLSGHEFPWPQDLTPKTSSPGGTFDASLIAAEKRSAVQGSLYGLRREIIQEADRAGLRLAVAGRGWMGSVPGRIAAGLKAAVKASSARQLPRMREALGDLAIRPRFPLGPIEDKVQAYGIAPVAIVVENSADYISEKLVDALLYGVVPIYVGPPLKDFGMPAGIAVQVPPDAKAVVAAASKLDGLERARLRGNASVWLGGDALAHRGADVLLGLGKSVGHRLVASRGRGFMQDSNHSDSLE